MSQVKRIAKQLMADIFTPWFNLFLGITIGFFAGGIAAIMALTEMVK